MTCVHSWRQLLKHGIRKDAVFFCTKCLAQARVERLMGRKMRIILSELIENV